MFWRKFGFSGPFIIEKNISWYIGNLILPLKCSFSIGYSIGRKYLPIWISVSVLDLNQSKGFGHTVSTTKSDNYVHNCWVDLYFNSRVILDFFGSKWRTNSSVPTLVWIKSKYIHSCSFMIPTLIFGCKPS